MLISDKFLILFNYTASVTIVELDGEMPLNGHGVRRYTPGIQWDKILRVLEGTRFELETYRTQG
jgi:hypothetical protein